MVSRGCLLVWTIIAGVIGLTGLIVGSISLSEVDGIKKYEKAHRYCLTLRGSDFFYPNFGGDNDSYVYGWLQVDPREKTIEYNFRFTGVSTSEPSLGIHGPTTEDDPLAVTAASFDAWNITITDGVASGKLTTGVPVDDDTDWKGLLKAMVTNPPAYYLLYKNTPYSTGAAGARLGPECSTRV